ncbi:MAG: hydrolase 2, exosortase A system-associated [Rubrivivax sp.]
MQAFFLEAEDQGGQRLCIHHPAQGPHKRGQILYLHPFAEEMNKSRRMAALQARAMAAAGYEVLQIDLLGCGDSSGDFGDASWEAWVADAAQACRWLNAQPRPAPLWIWGLRAGCLLAVEVARRLASAPHLLLVQPPVSGKTVLQQFLRLKVAGEMLDGSGKGLMAELRQALSQGQSVEIAGYRLSAALSTGLEAANLSPRPLPPDQQARLLWLELSSQQPSEWSPVAAQAQERWREAGWQLHAEQIAGPAFWQTTEIEDAPALVDGVVRGLLQQASGADPKVDQPLEHCA